MDGGDVNGDRIPDPFAEPGRGYIDLERLRKRLRRGALHHAQLGRAGRDRDDPRGDGRGDVQFGHAELFGFVAGRHAARGVSQRKHTREQREPFGAFDLRRQPGPVLQLPGHGRDRRRGQPQRDLHMEQHYDHRGLYAGHGAYRKRDDHQRGHGDLFAGKALAGVWGNNDLRPYGAAHQGHHQDRDRDLPGQPDAGHHAGDGQKRGSERGRVAELYAGDHGRGIRGHDPAGAQCADPDHADRGERDDVHHGKDRLPGRHERAAVQAAESEDRAGDQRGDLERERKQPHKRLRQPDRREDRAGDQLYGGAGYGRGQRHRLRKPGAAGGRQNVHAEHERRHAAADQRKRHRGLYDNGDRQLWPGGHAGGHGDGAGLYPADA